MFALRCDEKQRSYSIVTVGLQSFALIEVSKFNSISQPTHPPQDDVASGDACPHAWSEGILRFQAYRLEPLVLKSYTSVHALRIHRFDSLNKAPYDASPLQPIVSGSKKQFTTPATEQKPVPEAATCTAELRSQDDFGAIYAERTRRASGGEDDQASERMTDDDQATNNDKSQPPTFSSEILMTLLQFPSWKSSCKAVAVKEMIFAFPQGSRRFQTLSRRIKKIKEPTSEDYVPYSIDGCTKKLTSKTNSGSCRLIGIWKVWEKWSMISQSLRPNR